MAATLVKEILANSWEQGHFDLQLPAKQNVLLHIIAMEESYEEFFVAHVYMPSNQAIFNEHAISQFWFARFLSSAGSYHLAAIINERLNARRFWDLSILPRGPIWPT